MADVSYQIAPEKKTHSAWASANPTLGTTDSGDEFAGIVLATAHPTYGDILVWGRGQTYSAAVTALQFMPAAAAAAFTTIYASGDVTIGGDILNNANSPFKIMRSVDTGYTQLIGGSAANVANGAYIEVAGNTQGTIPAQIRYFAGNIAGGIHRFFSGASAEAMRIDDGQDITAYGDLSIVGALSKGSGSFKIPHPVLPGKYLVHSFVESPGADLIYSGMVELVKGVAIVDINKEAGMYQGTFQSLCRNVRRKTSNESGFTQVKSSFDESKAILKIEAQDKTCTDEIFWQIIGERKDEHMYKTGWTDDDGKVIVEPDIYVSLVESIEKVESENEKGEIVITEKPIFVQVKLSSIKDKDIVDIKDKKLADRAKKKITYYEEIM